MNNNYTKLAILLFFAASFALSAQSKVQLRLADVVAPGGQETICAPIIADSFPNIAAAGFSVRWDSTVVLLQEVRFGQNPLDITSSSLSEPDAASLVLSWTSAGLQGITLPSGTTIMELCFSPQLESGSSPLTWEGINPNEFVQENEFVAYPDTLFPGSITYGNEAALTVLPGDTNGDRQVDHRDLLNLGLLAGATGPTRPDASTAFTDQTAPVWPGTLTSGLNYANVDANGDGSINAADADVVSANYARAASTFTQPADVSVPTGPAFSLVEEAGVINAGVATELSVTLGDGNDPDAVGYALAFTLEYDPNQVEENSITVSYDGSFLGDNLLTIERVSTTTPGRMEFALTRQDQVNTTTPGGKVCTISLITIDPNDGAGTMSVPISVVPNAFLRADQSSAPVNGAVKTLTVQTALAVREPSWASALSVFPNPYTNGPLALRGDLPAFDAVRVLTTSGQLLRAFSGNQRALQLDDLPAGTYLVQVEIDGERVNRRVIKR